MTHNPQPKQKALRNPAYLKYIRSLPCVVCVQKSIAHHVRRSYWGAGGSQKPHDYVAIPLCNGCHKPETEKEISVERVIIDNLIAYIESKRNGE